MSHSELAIAGFYDHEQEIAHRAPDWGGDDLFTAPGPRRRRFERGAHPVRLREEAHEPVAAPAHPVPSVPERDEAPAGRRTVTITGRPDGPAAARRPARTLDERIMHRPERIASWTCSLGALSILLAIVTAQ